MLIVEDHICYVSDDQFEFIEIDHSEPSINQYGLDTLTRTYEGRNSLLDAFLATWNEVNGTPRNVPDWQYPGMVSVELPSISRGAAFSTVAIKFTGKISNAEPLVTIKDSFREDTAQVQGGTGTTPNVVFPVMIDFRAPTTSYEYFAASRPATTRYSDGATGNAVAIDTVATGADGIINTVSAHGFTAGQAIIFAGVTGTTPDINGNSVVKTVTDDDTFTIETNVTVGGTGGTVSNSARGIEIVRARGTVEIATVLYGAENVAIIPVQKLGAFEREQIGTWWRCTETWEWTLTPNVLYVDDAAEVGFVIVNT